MSDPRQPILAQLEAQRDAARQASREMAELDVRAVLVAVQVKISEGRVDEAKAIVAAYRKNMRSN